MRRAALVALAFASAAVAALLCSAPRPAGAASLCSANVAHVYRLPSGAFAVTLRDTDEDGGVVRVAFKGSRSLSVTPAVPMDTPPRANGAFVSDPIVVAKPAPDADTVVIKLVGTGEDPLTCNLLTLALGSVPAATGAMAQLNAVPVALMQAYDLAACSAAPAVAPSIEARLLAGSPVQLKYVLRAEQTDVQVLINEDGDVIRASVIHSDDAALNESSLNSAVLSTFAPSVVACRPLGGAFKFVVQYRVGA